jgi:hypothetical protein
LRQPNANIANIGDRSAKNSCCLGQVGTVDAVFAVVVTVRVLVTGAPLGVTETGLKLQAASEGRPLHVKLTAELKPFIGVTVNVAVPLCPATTMRLVGLTEI